MPGWSVQASGPVPPGATPHGASPVTAGHAAEPQITHHLGDAHQAPDERSANAPTYPPS